VDIKTEDETCSQCTLPVVRAMVIGNFLTTAVKYVVPVIIAFNAYTLKISYNANGLEMFSLESVRSSVDSSCSVFALFLLGLSALANALFFVFLTMERKVQAEKNKRLSEYQQKYERLIDPERSSSDLDPSGNTRKEDR